MYFAHFDHWTSPKLRLNQCVNNILQTIKVKFDNNIGANQTNKYSAARIHVHHGMFQADAYQKPTVFNIIPINSNPHASAHCASLCKKATPHPQSLTLKIAPTSMEITIANFLLADLPPTTQSAHKMHGDVTTATCKRCRDACFACMPIFPMARLHTHGHMNTPTRLGGLHSSPQANRIPGLCSA